MGTTIRRLLRTVSLPGLGVGTVRPGPVGLGTVLAVCVPLTVGSPAAAQEEEPEVGWFFDAELAGVWTGGNSESFTFGLTGKLRRLWEGSRLRFEAGSIRTESSRTTRTAVGSVDDFELVEETETEKTAENYALKARYDYQINEQFFVYGGSDWLRDTFAGIESRLLFVVGAGNLWVDSDRITLTTDGGATLTVQEDVVDDPSTADTFAGLRFGYELGWRLTGSAELSSVLIGDWNLSDADDLRIEFTNGLPISISEVLALKPELKLRWRNAPSLAAVDLLEADGTPTGETVMVPLNKLDSYFTLALVVKL